MAGLAGAVIGLTVGIQPNIGSTTKAVADGTTSARGCRTNFIGFGKALSNTVQTQDSGVQKDFNATDDTVQEANSLAQLFAPTYTGAVLTWVDTTP